MTNTITLINPRYPYGGGRTYLPTGLMVLGSQLLEVGWQVYFVDLNHTTWEEHLDQLRSSDVVGFTVVGPPYIPVVIQTIREMRQQGIRSPIWIGGEGINRMRPTDFDRWFKGLDATQQDPGTFAGAIDKVGDRHPFRSAFDTPMTPMLLRLSRTQLEQYLSTEFSLFLSQGCKFGCSFCAAAKARREQYRAMHALESELEFICEFLQQLDRNEMSIYLSNLDGFQNPAELEERLCLAHSVASRHGITPHIRCLATSRCTTEACKYDPELPRRLRGYGLEIVAFGVDGADEETWKNQHKFHNDLSQVEFAARCMEKAGITVELLMVIGFQDDTLRALGRDLIYSLLQGSEGRIIRPYLAKTYTPAGSWPEDDPQIQAFLNDSDLLQRLDYAMIGSKHTNPRRFHRWAANLTYLAIIGLMSPHGLCPTRPLFPLPRRGWLRPVVAAVNRWMPPDR